MLNTLIVGASGYTGAELAAYLQRHSKVNLSKLMVSAQSVDAGKDFSQLYPQYRGVVELPLEPMTDITQAIENIDIVFLATVHEVSHNLAPLFLQQGCTVFDLSGAYRVQNTHFYQQYYGFEHKNTDWLSQAVYGLAEWNEKEIRQAQLIAVPGCYPTVSQLSLKPLVVVGLLDTHQWPVINATSGISGVGRKAALTSSFCEVSLQPYRVFTHRHQPEIVAHLGIDVIFTPHLGHFARGILVTITCKLKAGVTASQVRQVFEDAYQNKPLVRVYDSGFPALNAVVGTPFCDIGFAQQGEHLIVVGAEDNLLKGAAAQAVQCMNMRFGFTETESLL